ncbi:MAG: LPS export ABC transporter periplasmic protein LptC [Candidatus Pelagibacter sp.]
MSSKLLIQLSITLLIALILLVFYYFFFTNDNTFIKEDKVDVDNQINNKIVDLKYTANDIDGNSYIINSEYGEISDLDSNELKLQGVKAEIEIKNSESVIILSDYANYNKVTLNTYFYDNVKLTYIGHLITSDKMFLNYVNKDINIQENVVYEGYNNKLLADIIEIDLVTKFSKIYMLDKYGKVKVNIKNGNN